MNEPRWLKSWNRWADHLERKFITPWLGEPKEWHSWIYHTVFAALFGGGTGVLVAWLLPWAWATLLMGYAIGSTCSAVFYVWRETGDQYSDRLDSIMDCVGPILNALLAWVWWA